MAPQEESIQVQDQGKHKATLCSILQPEVARWSRVLKISNEDLFFEIVPPHNTSLHNYDYEKMSLRQDTFNCVKDHLI